MKRPLPLVAFSFVLGVIASPSVAATATQPIIPLWPAGAPGSVERKYEAEKVAANGGVSNIHDPSLTVYLPAKEKATGVAVIVVPGGGHRFLSIQHEGYTVAQWLADRGITAFVLKHRLGNDQSNPAGTPQPYKWDVHGLADGERAMRLVRSRAAEWNLRPDAIGMVGFSAGGEIVAQAAMRADPGKPDDSDPVERLSARPDFQGLVYPGKSSLIIPVKGAPPAFLACGFNDRKDISEGLANVYLRFKQAEVPTDLHVFAGAGHGFGLRETNKSPSGAWPERFREFLIDRKFIPNPQP